MTVTGGRRARATHQSIQSGSLRKRTWRRFLRGPDPVLLDELYVPALNEAARYDRCCAYFSSSVLAAAARGFGRLIERLIGMGDAAPRPAVRLIVNEELAAEDVRALVETQDTSPLERALTKRFKNPKDVLEKKRLAMLVTNFASGVQTFKNPFLAVSNLRLKRISTISSFFLS